MCSAPRRRLTAVAQLLAGSYDIYGCVARAVVSAIARAPTPLVAQPIAIWTVAVDAVDAAAVLHHHRRRAVIVIETTGVFRSFGGKRDPPQNPIFALQNRLQRHI